MLWLLVFISQYQLVVRDLLSGLASLSPYCDVFPHSYHIKYASGQILQINTWKWCSFVILRAENDVWICCEFAKHCWLKADSLISRRHHNHSMISRFVSWYTVSISVYFIRYYFMMRDLLVGQASLSVHVSRSHTHTHHTPKASHLFIILHVETMRYLVVKTEEVTSWHQWKRANDIANTRIIRDQTLCYN